MGGVELSNGAVSFALESLLAVPEHMEIVGYGSPPWYRWIFGGLATIQLPVVELAHELVKWCAQTIAFPGRQPVSPQPLLATFRGPPLEH